MKNTFPRYNFQGKIIYFKLRVRKKSLQKKKKGWLYYFKMNEREITGHERNSIVLHSGYENSLWSMSEIGNQVLEFVQRISQRGDWGR